MKEAKDEFLQAAPPAKASPLFSRNRLSRKSTACTLGLLLSLVLVLPSLGLSAQTPQRQPTVPSDFGMYYRIFHHVAVLNQMADAALKQGKDRSNLRQLVRLRAGLTEAEGESLQAISLQCDNDVAAQDAKAKAIIDQFHAQYPPGRPINPSFPPIAPAVLASMWQDRNNIILAARDQLRVELGEQDFAKFDKFVKSTGPAPAIRPAFPPLPGAVQK